MLQQLGEISGKKKVVVVFSPAKLNSRDATGSSCMPWMLMGSWCWSCSPTNFLHISRKFLCSCFGHHIIAVNLQLYEFSEKEQNHEWAGRVWGVELAGLGRWCLRTLVEEEQIHSFHIVIPGFSQILALWLQLISGKGGEGWGIEGFVAETGWGKCHWRKF